MESDFILSGRHVSLRRFARGDITESYLSWLNDPAVVRFSNQRFRRHDKASAQAYLASFEDSVNLFLSIVRIEDGVSIGTMTAYISPPHGTVDVGIMVGDASSRGKGLGQDAWNTLLDWLSLREDIRKITAGTVAPNLAMRRLMERSEMILEGKRIAQEIIEGKPEDILYYARFPIR